MARPAQSCSHCCVEVALPVDGFTAVARPRAELLPLLPGGGATCGRHTETLSAAAAASESKVSSSVQERVKDILVVVSGLLFGFGYGALTAATMYLVWSLIASTCASGYDDIYSDDEDQLSNSESPEKAGYAILDDAEDYGAAGSSAGMSDSELMRIKAPSFNRPAGRPRQNRFKGALDYFGKRKVKTKNDHRMYDKYDSDLDVKKMKRIGCGECSILGHSANICEKKRVDLNSDIPDF
ncbi:uncharacterized protein C2845_PM01G22530 [Panicum miliaceum]|uniref:Uncharacterized protein n=1 Tax=Panicum miliaceum TaxID=4540 RepID=A0A3L6TET1_PANMI|nr:uncharacterized protein C2845_PM01G22530 [Panicum miliaceum]